MYVCRLELPLCKRVGSSAHNTTPVFQATVTAAWPGLTLHNHTHGGYLTLPTDDSHDVPGRHLLQACASGSESTSPPIWTQHW